jgi:hypothetical protein
VHYLGASSAYSVLASSDGLTTGTTLKVPAWRVDLASQRAIIPRAPDGREGSSAHSGRMRAPATVYHRSHSVAVAIVAAGVASRGVAISVLCRGYNAVFYVASDWRPAPRAAECRRWYLSIAGTPCRLVRGSGSDTYLWWRWVGLGRGTGTTGVLVRTLSPGLPTTL